MQNSRHVENNLNWTLRKSGFTLVTRTSEKDIGVTVSYSLKNQRIAVVEKANKRAVITKKRIENQTLYELMVCILLNSSCNSLLPILKKEPKEQTSMLITSLLSLCFKLNSLSSLSFSSNERRSSPSALFVALQWTHSSKSIYFVLDMALPNVAPGMITWPSPPKYHPKPWGSLRFDRPMPLTHWPTETLQPE